tara:strand:+ start:261 stop:704 length:444 start_codon:yes stop_codon:yes gene_type:complete
MPLTMTNGLTQWRVWGFAPSRCLGSALACWVVLATVAHAGTEFPQSSIGRGTQLDTNKGEFFELERYVPMASPQGRVDFTHQAIRQMAIKHDEALTVARYERPHTEKKRFKQPRWMAATQACLDQTLNVIGQADSAACTGRISDTSL